MRRVQILLSLPLALAVLLSFTPDAKADTFQTYNLAWSGNGATAIGVITLDLSTLINPTPTTRAGSLRGTGYFDIISDITGLSVTVTGAGAVDGTFTKANLCACSNLGSYTYWYTHGTTMDMEGNVLGELLTVDLGEFNLFFTSLAPGEVHN